MMTKAIARRSRNQNSKIEIRNSKRKYPGKPSRTEHAEAFRASGALIPLCVAAALFLGAAAPAARADAAADWQQVQALDSAPPTGQWKTREEARAGTLEYLAKQEQALRAFIAGYPDDAHAPDAKLRLAHLLATRADLEQSPRERREAEAVLDQLEREPAMRDRRADVEFARISIFMQRVDAIMGTNRAALLEKARGFAKEFPEDRRLAALLAEVASVFEDQPKTARALLEQARPVARTPELQARIGDDLKRLDLLGKPLEMKWNSVAGTSIDLEKLRGKVVLMMPSF